MLRQQFRETTNRIISIIESVYDTVTFNQKNEISNVNLKADHSLFHRISSNLNSFQGIVDHQKRMESFGNQFHQTRVEIFRSILISVGVLGDDLNDGISVIIVGHI